jgi:pimeloyl-ACP methyl ester carboxylesterase
MDANLAAVEDIITNDGTRLVCECTGPASGPVCVLIHGWSGSRRYWDAATPLLVAAGCRVVRYDLRFHGDSDSPPSGAHVPRLAADLRDILAHLALPTPPTVVGSSLGAAIIWAYAELFGTDGKTGAPALGGAVFVDQAPLQNRAPDWELGSRGCYDAASLAALQAELDRGLQGIADGNEAGCLALPVPSAVRDVLRAETLRCDAGALGRLMANHTALDWRGSLLRLHSLPCLVLVGGQSGVFPVDGCLAVAKLVPDACAVVFERASHWLYVEQPQEFASLVSSFAMTRNEGRPKMTHIP